MKSSASELGLRRCCITRQFSGQMERLVCFVVPPKLAISLAPIGRYRNVRDDPMMAQEDQKKKKWKNGKMEMLCKCNSNFRYNRQQRSGVRPKRVRLFPGEK